MITEQPETLTIKRRERVNEADCPQHDMLAEAIAATRVLIDGHGMEPRRAARLIAKHDRYREHLKLLFFADAVELLYYDEVSRDE